MSDTKAKIERRLVAILTVDTVGYSRMMEANEAGTLARLKAILADVLSPQYSLALTLLGEAMSLAGNPKEGIAVIRKTLENSP